MKDKKLIIHEISIGTLIAAEYNPRRLSKKQFEDIKRSIESFGFIDPIIVNKHPDRRNIIIGGHQRTKIAEKMGYKFVPAVFVELDKAKEMELNIRLNKNAGEWDYDVLANQFDVLELVDYGFTLEELGAFDKELDEGMSDEEYLASEGLQVIINADSIVERKRVEAILVQNGITFKIKNSK